uniref:Uncharacterized protein n=1 Tax=Daphnia galeata TaxID=27404 RepID=A0A8J2RXM0_9CRUS|nr:unnamed protein product [Daphnia galeata]
MENNVEDTDSKNRQSRKNVGMGKKLQVKLPLIDNWKSLSDTKTTKQLIWDVIANGLEEAGLTVRGSNNHPYKPPYVSDFLSEIKNPSKFRDTEKRTQKLSKKPRKKKRVILYPKYKSRASFEKQKKMEFYNYLADSSTNENEKSTKEMDGDSNSRISDHGIYCDSLDEKSSNDGITEPKKKK